MPEHRWYYVGTTDETDTLPPLYHYRCVECWEHRERTLMDIVITRGIYGSAW